MFLTNEHDFLVVKGAAGTGKTSIMKAVADYMNQSGLGFELLAPTGRAAQNIAVKAGYHAETIHGHVYIPETNEIEAKVRFMRKSNQFSEKRVYIIDESSMISNLVKNSQEFESDTPMLSDLIAFIKQGNKANKIIFVGDDCQLPPVGYEAHQQSPALDATYLQKCFQLKGDTIRLSRVMRQSEGSYILDTAYQLRSFIESGEAYTASIGKAMYNPDHVTNLYLQRFDIQKPENVSIIAYGNDYIDRCNKLIRSKLGLGGILTKNDLVVLNRNYFGKDLTYIPSGEVAKITATGATRVVAELRFMEVELTLFSKGGEAFSVSTKIMLDSLENPKLVTLEKKKALFASANKNNPAYRSSKNICDDEFLSAMQVNYAHAFNCHKAQGSEWNTILLNSWMPNTDQRFLYTAVTRAKKELFTNNAHTFKK
jgi:exodeoxyribonuclease-5